MGKRAHEGSILVVGLGRFGSTLADALQRLGHEVLAVDTNHELVQYWSGKLTHVVEADATSEAAMRQLGIDSFRRAIVAIGTGIEASLLAAGTLIDLGVPEVWAKAITPQHGRILERIGAQHVVYPERDAGERVAHLLSGRLIDFIEFDDGYAIVKIRAPRLAIGSPLGASGLRSKFGITIVGIKRRGEAFHYATAESVVHEGDVLIVSGKTDLVEQFAREAC